jgi:hypothetical protein
MKSKKYPKVKWNPEVIKRLYKGGKNVAEIARHIGYPKNCGQNRVTNLLKKSGLHKEAK